MKLERADAVHYGMTSQMAWTRPLIVITLVCMACGRIAIAGELPRQPQEQAVSDVSPLAGTWLPQSAEGWNHSLLGDIRSSKLMIRSHSFALANYRGLPKDVTGTFSIDATTDPKTIDIKSEEIDLSPGGEPVKYPAASLPGIYRLDGDVLTVCFATGENRVRPTRFEAAPSGTLLLVLRRANPDFKSYPKTVSVTVLGPDGKPVPNVNVFTFMSLAPDRNNLSAVPQWKYLGNLASGPTGTVSIPYEEFRVAGVRDTARKLIGFVTAPPALLQKGTVTLQLQPECLVSGKLVCDTLAKAGKPVGWTNVYLLKDGERVGGCMSLNGGAYQFPVSPGHYTLYAYGTNLHKKTVPITVPAGQAEYHPAPIELALSRLELMKGHPAPDFVGVVGWKGTPVKLADLRGKYVLIDFWGYWYGPCVGSMPVLLDLHEKYKDKGLAILSVHVDIDGDVDTAAKLDEKIAEYKRTQWNGRDLPFPTALSAGKETPDGYDGITAAQYGILGYPTTVLIDRDGNVVDEFEARDTAAASAEIDHLLAVPK